MRGLKQVSIKQNIAIMRMSRDHIHEKILGLGTLYTELVFATKHYIYLFIMCI